MPAPQPLLFLAGLVGYSVAAALHFTALARGDPSGRALAVAARVLGVSALLHAAQELLAPRDGLTVPAAFSVVSLLAVLAHLVHRARTGRDRAGALVAPLALVAVVVAHFSRFEAPREIDPVLLALHVTANLLGVGLFLVAGLAGGFYLMQARRLKRKRLLRESSELPPLEALDRTVHRLLLAAFPLLTFGVASGAAFGTSAVGAGELVRVVLAWATWLLLGLVLVLRALAGWRGRRAAWGALLGVACVVAVVLLYALRAGAEPERLPDGGGAAGQREPPREPAR